MLNQIKTVILLAVLTALLLWFGHVIGGQSGLIIGLCFALLINFGSYWWSDKLVLAMYKARPVNDPQLSSIVKDIARKAQIPKPKVFIVPSDSPNAFATGRNPQHASVAVTTGLLANLDKEELKGVLAHEIAHVKNRDILIATITGTLAGAIAYLAMFARFAAIFGGMRDDEGAGNFIGLLVLAIITPIIALLLQLAISRSREFIADASGAKIIHNPNALASALLKLEHISKKRPMRRGSEATAHLFIVNPFTLKGLTKLFSTHPAIEKRVKRLRELKV